VHFVCPAALSRIAVRSNRDQMSSQPRERTTTALATADLIVVGAGAAGLATAIFAKRANHGLRVMCVDGAQHVGAKILVSGGSRCNVTNRVVTEHDFWGGPRRTVKAVLRAFTAERTVAFFRELGVPLHEEEEGKLFPDTNRARTVLDALLAECRRLGVRMVCGARVTDIQVTAGGFLVAAGRSEWRAPLVVLATGGQSLPKSGSDGFGYQLAARLGHSCVPTTPGLVPLLLANGSHMTLAGVSHLASITLRVRGRAQMCLTGSLLWTHFGVSGPVVLNASRHWLRAIEDHHIPQLFLSVRPDQTFSAMDALLITAARARPRATIASVLSAELPASVAAAWLECTRLDGGTVMAQLSRNARRALAHALVDSPLAVTGSRGYTHAEVTAGGVPLDEIDSATMQSRKCPGLFLVGEILDVDGRLGGFNFQWAWSTGYIAGNACGARVLTSSQSPCLVRPR
jgi:predicted Rossmann fold flavoprotein